MASVSISYQISDDNGLSIEVSAEAEHPDLLDELATRAVRILRDSLTVVCDPAPEPE
jgi:hypothetical protein